MFPLRWRAVALAGAIALAGLSAGARTLPGQRGAAPPSRDLVAAVRADLAHGKPADARARLSAAPASSRAAAVGKALIAEYVGKDDDARALLRPLVHPGDRDDAALELGLLDLRHGRDDEGRPLLEHLIEPWSDMTPADYLRLARAAVALGELHLAGDAFQRIGPQGSGGAEVQSDWADLFYEAQSVPEAVKGYRYALAADSAWVPAYVGLARALADEAPDQADAALKKARALAPDDPSLLRFVAGRALSQDDVPAAKTALDRLDAIQPGTIEAPSLRAAIAYAERRDADIDPLVAQARAVDPTSDEPYRMVGEEAAHKYRFDDAAAWARKAVAADDSSFPAHADLGLYLMRTGDEAAARQELERAWDLSQHTQPVVFNLLTLLDDLDAFTVVPHGPFIFKFAPKEAGVLAPYALPLADEAYALYQKQFGFTPKGPILVEIFAKHDDFAVRTLGLPGIVGALGACFGRVVTMDSPTARQPGDFSWEATLWHELAHVFTLQLSDYRVPRWLTEGLSVLEEHRRNPAWGRELTLEYAHALSAGQTFGFKGLADGFNNGDRLPMAYFEASLAAEYLADLGGDEGLQRLLKAYAAGDTDAEAFEQAYGKTEDQIDAGYNTFVDQRFGALRDAMKTPPGDVGDDDLVGLAGRAKLAPGNYLSQLAYGEALFNLGRFDEARAPLERAAALVPEARGAESPHAMLAAIAEQAGDTTRARAELRALLTYDHTNIAAARKLVSLASAAGAADATAPADLDFGLRLVADLDPFDGPVHTELGQRALAARDAATAVTEFTAALALSPVNMAEAHTNLGEALLAAGRKDEAKKEALAALEIAPTYPRAQDLLLAILGK